MSLLEISEIQKAGELRWGVTLISDQGVHVLRSTTPIAKGEALAAAKALKHKGPDAPFLWKYSEDQRTPAWAVEKVDDGWLLRFNLISDTPFEVLTKPEDITGDPKIVERTLEAVRGDLAKAEIRWNPPEADPAYAQKESDETPTTGHPGS